MDLGYTEMISATGKRIKLYGFGFVLSHSRYKYVEWFDRPFTAITFTQALYRACEFIGGMPKEIVFDQDRVLAVSENYGDIKPSWEHKSTLNNKEGTGRSIQSGTRILTTDTNLNK